MSTANITDFTQQAVDLQNSIDVVWISTTAYLIFFMQLGFSILEAGTVRQKNVHTLFFINIFEAVGGVLFWWWTGFGFAFGSNHGDFLGKTYHGGEQIHENKQYAFWLFQWGFVSTCATIVTGSVAERMKIVGQMGICVFVNAWVYPIVAHWVWGGGFLQQYGVLDFAGSGVVHLTGGTFGLIGALFLKPRKGRFDDKNRELDYSQMGNPAYVTIGTLILWLGWYGFNCGSTLVTSGSNVGVIGRVGVNCTLGAASGGLTTMFLHWFKNRGTQDIYSVGILCNGILAGLVGITASCNNIEMEGAFVIGIVAGCVYYGYKNLLEKFKIDDPLDAFPLHGGCGSLGLIAVGWFDRDSGILYGHGGAQFGKQLLGGLIIFAWTAAHAAVFYGFLKLIKQLRTDEKTEEVGFDAMYFGQKYFTYKDLQSHQKNTDQVVMFPVANLVQIPKAYAKLQGYNELSPLKGGSGFSQLRLATENEQLKTGSDLDKINGNDVERNIVSQVMSVQNIEKNMNRDRL